ncbi:molybdate ABC transporter substrate-binding protein [Coraliomargarita parva]|uniref:molybdate ABC transporter substrate-binding protein n=1 Tax=Coraliomargarita parva TaxID=3014050 RepID=UPI0022B5C690|nr:molybdate ABC transporter substrate-binding protein [Coraliomargarita parva]
MNIKSKFTFHLYTGLLGLLLALTACKPSQTAGEDSSTNTTVTVFAASSATNAVQDLAKLYEAQTGVHVVTSFASSSTLAKQIEQGAPADVFISANPKWMDYLEKAAKLVDGTREDLLGNRIVLIAPRDSPVDSVAIQAGLDLVTLLGPDGRLGMGDPAHVPAGIYGKQALESLGLWSVVESRTAPMSDVRAALAIVERGETPFGVVYATDAAMSGKVKVVGVFPEGSHAPIVYPAAVVSTTQLEASDEFRSFLKTAEAQAVFGKYGFALAK